MGWGLWAARGTIRVLNKQAPLPTFREWLVLAALIALGYTVAAARWLWTHDWFVAIVVVLMFATGFLLLRVGVQGIRRHEKHPVIAPSTEQSRAEAAERRAAYRARREHR